MVMDTMQPIPMTKDDIISSLNRGNVILKCLGVCAHFPASRAHLSPLMSFQFPVTEATFVRNPDFYEASAEMAAKHARAGEILSNSKLTKDYSEFITRVYSVAEVGETRLRARIQARVLPITAFPEVKFSFFYENSPTFNQEMTPFAFAWFSKNLAAIQAEMNAAAEQLAEVYQAYEKASFKSMKDLAKSNSSAQAAGGVFSRASKDEAKVLGQEQLQVVKAAGKYPKF
jgi:hypothetical protein